MDIRGMTKKEYDALGVASREYLETGSTSKKCPRCGKDIVVESEETTYIVRCKEIECIGRVHIGI